MLRKIVGFVLGFGAGFGLLILLAYATHFIPRGAGWLMFLVLCGMGGAAFASSPAKYVDDARTAVVKRANLWWSLSPRLRLILVVSVIWVVASYLMQEEYEEDFRIVFFPPLALIVFHFAEKLLVKGRA